MSKSESRDAALNMAKITQCHLKSTPKKPELKANSLI